jgi:peptidoglycan/xylan/chitin deacetylase (PgdA/CDA1 family)
LTEVGPASTVPVLLYHHVGPARPGTYPSLTVDPARFRRHIAWLARRGYRSLTIENVAQWAAHRRPPPGRSVLITFDDAYADLAAAAFPALLEAGLSAVVFVVTGCIGETNRWDAATGGAHAILTADQIRQWSERGIVFGAHTRTHPDLTSLSEADVRQEMAGSKADLEALLGRAVNSFAYPYGFFDAATVRIAASIFDVAFTAEPGRNLSGTDPHQLRRSMVWRRDTPLDVELRIRLGFSPHERARAWLYSKRRLLRMAPGQR